MFNNLKIKIGMLLGTLSKCHQAPVVSWQIVGGEKVQKVGYDHQYCSKCNQRCDFDYWKNNIKQ